MSTIKLGGTERGGTGGGGRPPNLEEAENMFHSLRIGNCSVRPDFGGRSISNKSGGLVPGSEFKPVRLCPRIAASIVSFKPDHGSGQSLFIQREA